MTDQGNRGHLGAQKGPWRTELVEGDPLQVAGRELVPLVRVTSSKRRQAYLYSDGVGGRGYGFLYMRPVALLEDGEPGKLHQIRNETARTIGRLALVALLVPWLAALLVYLSRRLDSKDSQSSSA